MVNKTSWRLSTKQVQDNLQRWADLKFPKTEKKFLEQLAKRGIFEASALCPYRTGNLRTSIRAEVPQGSKASERIDVIAGGISGMGFPRKFVNYAKYVHEGWGQKANPFLRVGMERASQQMGDVVRLTTSIVD